LIVRMNVELAPLLSAFLCLAMACDDSDDPGQDGGRDVGPKGEADAGRDAGSGACPAHQGPTVHEASINGDVVWTAEGSPHVLPYDTTVYGTLVIDRCAEVQIAARRTISVRGELRAEGTADGRILITSMEVGQRWASFTAVLGGGKLSFAHTTIEGGGEPLNTLPYLAGAIDAQGTDPALPPQETVHVDHVEIAGSASNGIVLRDGAAFTNGSTDLTVSSVAQFPVSIWGSAVGSLPTGSYIDNANDEILIPAIEIIPWNATFHHRGVPYRIGHEGSSGDLRVQSGDESAPAVLTIEPGVTLRFKRDGVFKVEHFKNMGPASGALVAVGTPTEPITFTSAELIPSAGDWYGLWFGSTSDPRNRLDHVVIEYAGKASASGSGSCHPDGPGVRNAGAVRFIAYDPPASPFITNTRISESPGHGIDRGWLGAEIDFLPTNTFMNVAGCWQSYPNVNGCPQSPPCPRE
jgi:hypothetical protein